MKNRDIEIKMLNEDVKGINKMTFTDKPECGIKGVFFTNNEKVKGGKRPNAGRKKLNKIKRTYSIDIELLQFKITSKNVNELLRKEYMNQ